MEPIEPAQRLERPVAPPLSPERDDDIDEDEEDESDVSTEIESEVLSQQFKSLPWPFPAVTLSLGISPSASTRRGISPLASDQQTCVSGSSLTVWSGAQVVYGGGTGTIWASGLGFSRFEKLRAPPHSGTSGASPRAGAGAASKGLMTTIATPTPATRPMGGTTPATIAPITTVTSSHCELTSKNLDRLRETRGPSDALQVAHWKANTQRTGVPLPAVIAVGRARSDYAAGPGGTRVSRASALLKQQAMPAWQRGVIYSGARALADVPARVAATTAAKSDDGLKASVDGLREEQSATADGTRTTSLTPPSAVGEDAHSCHDDCLPLRAEKDDDSDGSRGVASGDRATVTTAPQFSPAATPLAEAAPGVSHSTNKGDNAHALVKHQHLGPARTHYQGQILQLEDCTATGIDETSLLPWRAQTPRAATRAGATTTGSTTSATCGVVHGTRTNLASASVGERKSALGTSSQYMTGGRGVQAARGISVAGRGAHSGTLLPSSVPPFEKEVEHESSEAVCGTKQLPLADHVREPNDQAASGIDDLLDSCNVGMVSPKNARRLVVHLPTLPQTHPAISALVSEKANRDGLEAELRSVDQRNDEAVNHRGGAEGMPLSPALTHRVTSVLSSSSPTTSSRPPFLSLTAIGVGSATSGVLRSATQTSPRLSAALQRITMPHKPQQQMRPAVIISSTGTTDVPLSHQLLTTVTVTSPSNTGDLHTSVAQGSRLDPSRCSAVRTGITKCSVSCDTRMPSSADCLPSVGSTQPPLSLRTPDGGGGLRWQLSASSHTSSAGASDQRSRSGRAHNANSISSASMASSLHEVCAPAATAEHSSTTVPSFRSGLKSEMLLTLDEQAGAAGLNSNHVDRGSNTTVASTKATTLISAVPAPATTSAVRDHLSDSADKQQIDASSSVEVALATSPPAGIGAGSSEKCRGSSVQPASRVRRTPAPGWQPRVGGRINLADRRTSKPVRLGNVALTPSEVTSSVTHAVTCAVRDRPRTLASLDGCVDQSSVQAADTAGSDIDAAGPSVQADASDSPSAAVVAPSSGNAEMMPSMWKLTHSRTLMQADRRSMALVLPSPDDDGAGNGVPAAGVRGCPGHSRPRSHSLPAGALPSAGDTSARPSIDLLSLKKRSARIDQAAARQPLQQQAHRPESLPYAAPGAGDGGGCGLRQEESHRTLHNPPVAHTNKVKGNIRITPSANTVAAGGDALGQLLLLHSMHAIGDPGSSLEREAERAPGRLPTLGPNSTGATVNPAWLSSPNDLGIVGGHGDQSRVSAGRRKTVSVIRESPSARSRCNTCGDRSGSDTDGHHRYYPSRFITLPDTVEPQEHSHDDGVGESQERSKRAPARKKPPPHRRRSTNVSLPEDTEGGKVS
ncbi:hypothetical protein, conserved [Leishmania lindenbergi]|uniref:Protein kinase n=1 Tax=Leishmania lindenbergi TaxID=651832 RepID=A0AAW3B0F4_9TRYP